jgi:hypothetical protein
MKARRATSFGIRRVLTGTVVHSNDAGSSVTVGANLIPARGIGTEIQHADGVGRDVMPAARKKQALERLIDARAAVLVKVICVGHRAEK